MTQRYDRMCSLADSMPAAIRWRFCDYEQLLKKELKILAETPLELIQSFAPRDNDPRRGD